MTNTREVQIIYRTSKTGTQRSCTITVDADNIRGEALKYCQDRGWVLNFINR